MNFSKMLIVVFIMVVGFVAGCSDDTPPPPQKAATTTQGTSMTNVLIQAADAPTTAKPAVPRTTVEQRDQNITNSKLNARFNMDTHLAESQVDPASVIVICDADTSVSEDLPIGDYFASCRVTEKSGGVVTSYKCGTVQPIGCYPDAIAAKKENFKNRGASDQRGGILNKL